jgi:hypothetical protein
MVIRNVIESKKKNRKLLFFVFEEITRNQLTVKKKTRNQLAAKRKGRRGATNHAQRIENS